MSPEPSLSYTAIGLEFWGNSHHAMSTVLSNICLLFCINLLKTPGFLSKCMKLTIRTISLHSFSFVQMGRCFVPEGCGVLEFDDP